MKFSTASSVLAAAGICATAASAASVDAYIEAKNAYIANGYTCNEGFVLQMGADLSDFMYGETKLPVFAGIWGNLDLEDSKYDDTIEEGHFQEIDIWAGVDLLALCGVEDSNFGVSLCALEYLYPQGGYTPDRLVDLDVSYSCYVNPRARIKYYYDGDSAKKYNIGFDISHKYELAEDLGLKLAAEIWYINKCDVSPDGEEGLNNADFTVTLSWKALYASVMYCAQLDDDILPDHYMDEDGNWNGGYDADWIYTVGAGWTF